MKNSLNFILAVLLFMPSTTLLAQNMEWEWIMSAEGNATARSITTDNEGNVYVGGSFQDNMVIDTLTLISTNWSTDIYLLKFDPNGNLLWGKSFQGEWLENCRKIDTDNQGNVYITGEFCSNTVAIDSVTLINNYQTPYHDQSTFDVFIAKFNSDGELIWANSGGGIYHDHVNCMSVDNIGNAYIFGNFWSSTITFDSLSLINTGNLDLFITKYNNDGNAVWAKSAVGSGQDNAWSVVTDSGNNVYIAGSYRSSIISFDNFTLINSSDNFDLYLVKYNPDGNVLWVKSATGNDWDDAEAVTIDEEYNVYLTGHFRSDSLYFDSDTLYLSNPDNLNVDMYCAKLDSSGQVIWTNSSTGSAWIYPKSISAYKTSNISVVGTFTECHFGDTEYFGTTSVTSNGSYDIFLVDYDSSGNDNWSEGIGGLDMDFGQDIYRDDLGNLYIAAFFSSDSLTMDSSTFVNNYNNKMLIGKKRINNVTSIQRHIKIPQTVTLNQNFPNPFNPTTIIEFSLPHTEFVTLQIYNILGEEVVTLVAERLPAGKYKYEWDAGHFASGIYLYQLKTESFIKTKKLVLLK